MCAVLWHREGQVCSSNVCYSFLSKLIAVSNQNMYTPNLHIGILDDTTLVEVIGALSASFVVENCQNFNCQIKFYFIIPYNVSGA